MCQKPFFKDGMEYGCGQCMPCRINRRRVWTARLLLECKLWDKFCFITLTYDDNNLPENLSLSIRHYQLFLKRLRKHTFPERISYYIVGEYGSVTHRPHYHAVLFGLQPDVGLLRSDMDRRWINGDAQNLLNAWSLGNVHVGSVTEKSIAYACKHLTKGLRNGDDVLQRIPEFCRMSLRPAIGRRAMVDFAEFLTTIDGARFIAQNGDVMNQFRHDGNIYSFGRYLKGVLRKEAGMDDVFTQLAINLALQRADEKYASYKGDKAKTKKAIRKAHGVKANRAALIQFTREKL